MDGIPHLARALEDAAARHGITVVVNGTSSHGAIGVSLGRARDGRVTMLRQPGPGEGGRTVLNHPDATMEAGCLGARTLSWVERWAMELTQVTRHAARLEGEGLHPDAFSPRWFMANEIAVGALRAMGHDLGRVLAAATWERSQEGYTARIEDHEAFIEEAVFHRHLGHVRLADAALRLPNGWLGINDHVSLETSELELHGGGEIPETAVTAAPGRRFSEIAMLPGSPGGGTTIREARLSADGALLLVTNHQPATLA